MKKIDKKLFEELRKDDLEEEVEVTSKPTKKINEERLDEGTSNFGRGPENFPLLVFYTYDEFIYNMHNDPDYPDEANFEMEDEVDGHVYTDEEAFEDAKDEFEQKYFDDNNICVLDEDDQERLEEKLYNFNEESKKMAWDADVKDGEQDYGSNLNLEDVALKVTPGYYSAAYIEVEHEDYLDDLEEDFKKQQMERFSNFFKELKDEFHLTELSAGPMASNGERGYSVVKDDEPKDESIEECTLKEEKSSVKLSDVKEGQTFKPLDDILYCDIEVEDMFEDDEDLIAEFTDNGFVLKGTELYIPKGTEIKYTASQSVDVYKIVNSDYDFDVGEWSDDALDVSVEILENESIEERNLKEDKEYLSEKIERVLDECGILYGDIVEYEHAVNIVGVDEDEWEEVRDAIESELPGHDVLVPSEDHDEYDDEIIVKKNVNEDKKKKKEPFVKVGTGFDIAKDTQMTNHMLGSDCCEDIDDDEEDELATDRYYKKDDICIYQFPASLRDQDFREAEEYGLEYLGKVNDLGFQPGDPLIKGRYEDLKRYCKEYLDYVMHEYYLYKEGDIDLEDILEPADDSWKKAEALGEEKINEDDADDLGLPREVEIDASELDFDGRDDDEVIALLPLAHAPSTILAAANSDSA